MPSLQTKYQPNGSVQSETIMANGEPFQPILSQNSEGVLSALTAKNSHGEAVTTAVPNQPQDFTQFGDLASLQTMTNMAQFTEPNEQTTPQKGTHICHYRQGVNGFTKEELALAGENWRQQIRTRALGGVGRFTNQIQA